MKLLSRYLLRLLVCVLFVAGLSPQAVERAAAIAVQPPAPYTAPFHPAAPGDDAWDDRFDVLGVHGVVYAVVASGSSVYVGGYFSDAGGVDGTQGIARWDSITGTWSALDEGIPGYVYAIAVDGDYVYAGGLFNATGGYPSIDGTQSIARWNMKNNTWSALDEGIPGYVYDILVDGGYVYAGGLFNATGGYPSINGTQSIARWNIASQTWSALDEGIPGYVYSLAVNGGYIYAGGLFNAISGHPSIDGTQSIARWNIASQTWSALGEGVPGYVYSLAVDGTNLYVGGLFNTVGGYPSIDGTRNMAVWNTSTKTWSALGSGVGGYVYGIAAGVDGIYAGGLFLSVGNQASQSIALWHGNQPNPGDPWNAYWDDRFGGVLLNGTFVDDLAFEGDDVYVAGNFQQASGLPYTRGIARWNSQSGAWSPVGKGINDGYVKAVAVSGEDVYIGGNFSKSGGSPVNYIGRWDGTRWWDLGTGINGGVIDIAIRGGYVYVVGYFTIAGDQTANRIARWNRNTDLWEPLGSGIGLGAQELAILPDGSVIVVGITEAGGHTVNYVARWNGSSWSAYGSGFTCCVATVEASGSTVYIGGSFSKADGSPADFLAKGSGGAWTQVGSLNGTVLTLAISGSKLFVGGSFSMAGDIPVHYIAKWDGEGWSRLGSGLNNSPITMAYDEAKSNLYVGGIFNQAGNKPSTWFGLWHDAPLDIPPGSITGQVTGPTGAPLHAAIADVCQAAQPTACVWSGRTDEQGRFYAANLRDGDYVLKASSPAGVAYLPASALLPSLRGGIALTGQDIHLSAVQTPPVGTNLAPSTTGGGGIVKVSWNRALQLTTQGCAGGSASYQIDQEGTLIRSGPLVEQSPGRYSASLPPLSPHSGYSKASIAIRCPGNAPEGTDISFSLYINPTGGVRTPTGAPIQGAQVTLYAFDPAKGEFSPVPDGDASMSFVNRANPDQTDAYGQFGWDLTPGYYKVRAEKAGCSAPFLSTQGYVETDVLVAPITAAGIELRLDCGASNMIYLPAITNR